MKEEMIEMQNENLIETFGGEVPEEKRSFLKAGRLGYACKCPKCGEGQIFDGFLQVKPACEVCSEDLSHHRADDLPAYLNIFVVGHVVIGAMMILMTWNLMGMWATMFVTIFLCIAAAFVLMRPLKGMVVGIQWALRMHGFGGNHD
ncbi:MAG: DUF983 domain-containing protein [Salaquimonas sp.]